MRTPFFPIFVLFFACTPATYRQEADDQVYGILEKANARVTGNPTIFPIDRPVDTLRARLLNSTEVVQLSLLDALDVAAENSYAYQAQKERLYLSALTLTQRQHDFAIRWAGGSDAELSGTGNENPDFDLSSDLSSSVNTVSGTRIVASFFNSLLHAFGTDGFDGSSILSLTLSQPLLRGAGESIVREPLTQAERNLVYAVRTFEQFRRSTAVGIVSQYYGVIQNMKNLDNLNADLVNRRTNFERADALFEAGRGNLDDVDRAEQDLFTTQNAVVNSEAGLETQLDNFKQTLGLPTDSMIELDIEELTYLEEEGVTEVELEVAVAVELALSRRYDYQTTLDQVDDAARAVVLAEDALKSALDFSSAITVPSDPDDAFKLDWSNVRWAAGFNLDLALDKLSERNSYRSSLISLDVAIRNREQHEDQIKAEVRLDLRDIQANRQNYEVDVLSLGLAVRRVDSTRALFQPTACVRSTSTTPRTP